MAEFKTAYQKTKHWEGGYADVPKDRGGETYAGITRKFFPAWPGWKTVDNAKPLKNNVVIPGEELAGQVANFYYKEFWNRMNGGLIDSQAVAGFIFDWFVHSGPKGLRDAQSAMSLTADGVYGPKTIARINEQDEHALLAILKRARQVSLRGIAAADPSQAKFLKGWLNRVASF